MASASGAGAGTGWVVAGTVSGGASVTAGGSVAGEGDWAGTFFPAITPVVRSARQAKAAAKRRARRFVCRGSVFSSGPVGVNSASGGVNSAAGGVNSS